MASQQINTLVSSNDVEENVLLIGGEDPTLVEKILTGIVASYKLISSSRSFITYRCESIGATTFTLSITGVGPAATEIAVTEYSNCGARTIIRVGTCGAFSKTVDLGNVIISNKAIRFDGVSDLYLNRRFQAIASPQVIRELINSAETHAVKYSVGLTLSTSGFYAMGGISRYGEITFEGKSHNTGFEPIGFHKLRELIIKYKPLNVEMETATLLILSRIYGLKAGSACGISNHVPWHEEEQTKFTEKALKNSIVVGIGAIERLYQEK